VTKHHTADDDKDCERREDQRGWWAWFRRNMTIAAILAVGAVLASLIAWRDDRRDDIKAGREASVKVLAIEKDYVPKKDMETAIGATHSRIGRMETKIDTLTIEILKRLPDK